MAAQQIRHGPGSFTRAATLATNMPAAIGGYWLQRKPNVDTAVLAASAIPILRVREKAVVAARCGARMIVPVLLNLVFITSVLIIVLVIIAMNIRLHGLMFVRFAVIRPILRADQHRGQADHRKSQSEQCGFPNVLAHGLSLFSLKRPSWGRPNRAAIPGGA
jgi:hypothetical protein